MSSVSLARPARPYPGLRPFEAEEWSIFFGRERMIDEVIERLAQNGLILIHGASGSGKSSLVRAGVMPKLARQYRRHGEPWLTCAMRPSGGPLWNLAGAFARLEGRGDDVERVGAIARAFSARDVTLASVAASLANCRGKSLCLLVDQFEEVFRFEKETSREEAELFFDLIGRAASAEATEGVDLHVVVTMRSEFLGECARFAGLAETINRTQYLVPRMDDEALPRAVRRPAQMYGGSVSEGLADRLIASVRGREDELPLLQHGLMLMWDEAVRKTPPGGRPELDGAMVEAAGGLAELLSQHADAVMHAAAPDARRAGIVEGVFRALTDVNAEGSAIRRPQSFRALCAVTGATAEELLLILDAFRAPGVSFLTPYAPAPIVETARIDISHEALIRCWRRVSSGEDGWLKREFDEGLAWRSLLVEADAFANDRQRVLSPAATEDRSKLFATRGEAWSSRYGGGWTGVSVLLEASRNAAASAQRRTVGAAAALIVFAIGAVVAASFSMVELGKVEKAEKAAEFQKLEAQAMARMADEQRLRADAQRRRATAEETKAVEMDELINWILTRVFLYYLKTSGSFSDQQKINQEFINKLKNSAAIGSNSAALILGFVYVSGTVVPVDYPEAHKWFEKSAAGGNVLAMWCNGAFYESDKVELPDYAKAREWYEKAVAGGNANAMTRIAVLYENGRGVPQDYAKARDWYEKAASSGDLEAMNSLGGIYANAEGVAQDFAKAREWYEKAASAGNLQAMNKLGEIYANGQGVVQDFAKAREWYEKAATSDNADAMDNLGNMYRDAQGEPQDYGMAREWYEKAADAGSIDAMDNLGDLYAYAEGVDQDFPKAREWYEKGADAGSDYAMNRLGDMYANAEGVDLDPRKALDWYEKAASAGNSDAMVTLGDMFDYGVGVDQDHAKALDWYEKAASAGSAKAMNHLGKIYAKAQGVPQDYVKAREWFQKAAVAGNVDAMDSLADLYGSGLGGYRVYAEALFWSEKSASAIEADEVAANGAPGEKTAGALAAVSWRALFSRDFSRALSASERAHIIAPDLLISEINRAHALMFLDRTDEARTLYLTHGDEPIPQKGNKPWQQAILDDFDEFRNAGLTKPLMAEIETALGKK